METFSRRVHHSASVSGEMIVRFLVKNSYRKGLLIPVISHDGSHKVCHRMLTPSGFSDMVDKTCLNDELKYVWKFFFNRRITEDRMYSIVNGQPIGVYLTFIIYEGGNRSISNEHTEQLAIIPLELSFDHEIVMGRPLIEYMRKSDALKIQ